MSDEQHIVHEADLRGNRTEVPNIADEGGLSANEYRLLAHYYRRGNCYEGVRTTAKFCRMNKGTVIEARDSLEAKGWLNVQSQGKGKTLLITVKDVWLLNHLYYKKKLSPEIVQGVRDKGTVSVRIEGTVVYEKRERKKNPRRKTYINNKKHIQSDWSNVKPGVIE
jgi:hypothetical protein